MVVIIRSPGHTRGNPGHTQGAEVRGELARVASAPGQLLGSPWLCTFPGLGEKGSCPPGTRPGSHKGSATFGIWLLLFIITPGALKEERRGPFYFYMTDVP